jgi:hypothetical protein
MLHLDTEIDAFSFRHGSSHQTNMAITRQMTAANKRPKGIGDKSVNSIHRLTMRLPGPHRYGLRPLNCGAHESPTPPF